MVFRSENVIVDLCTADVHRLVIVGTLISKAASRKTENNRFPIESSPFCFNRESFCPYSKD